MNDCTFIVFGASGDLFKRKLFPALYLLITHKKINNFAIIGAAFDAAHMHDLMERSRPFIKGAIDETVWQRIQESAYYQQLNFTESDDYTALKERVVSIEKKHTLSGNRLFYFAAASKFFCCITERLAMSGLAQKKEGAF